MQHLAGECEPVTTREDEAVDTWPHELSGRANRVTGQDQHPRRSGLVHDDAPGLMRTGYDEAPVASHERRGVPLLTEAMADDPRVARSHLLVTSTDDVQGPRRHREI